MSQRFVLFPRLRYTEHDPAYRQAGLEHALESLVRHRQVHYQPGISTSTS